MKKRTYADRADYLKKAVAKRRKKIRERANGHYASLAKSANRDG